MLLAGDCPRCGDWMEVELPIKRRAGSELSSTKGDDEPLDNRS